MPTATVKKYFDLQLKDSSKDKTGCIYSNKKAEKNGYARVQLSKKDIPTDILEAIQENKGTTVWKNIKHMFKVTLHQLAYRACHGLIPDPETNVDIVHRCGNGKNKGDNKCCFNPDHLGTSSHKENMDAQRCVPFHTCPNCSTVFNDCLHNPQCKGSLSMEAQAKEDSKIHVTNNNKKVVNVIFVYDDGSVETKALNK